MGDEKFIVTLEIAGRKYPLNIKRSDEQAFRDAQRRIERKISQYRIKYGGANSDATIQDFVVMTALQVLVENFSLTGKNNTKPFEDKINSLIGELDDYLKK